MTRWLTAKETLELPEKIEEVNEIMLSRRIKTENNIFVFFYEDEDIFAQRLLKVMEVFDNKLDKKKIDFVKISDDGIDKDYSLECLPALVHFKEGEPTVFPGDLRSVSRETKKGNTSEHFYRITNMLFQGGEGPPEMDFWKSEKI